MPHQTRADRRRSAVDLSVHLVYCPRCNCGQRDRGPDAIYRCDRCLCQFDGDPDEGGDYSDRNPAARLERMERRSRR